MQNGRRTQVGFTYLGALLLVALVGGGLAAYGEMASHARQREKEAELVWIGGQFREAIGLYYQRTPGAVKQYPEKLEDLLEDRRFLTRQRYLRRIYADPFTEKADWGLVAAPSGGIAGVFSRGVGRSIRGAGSGREFANLLAGVTYQEWKFVYEPPVHSSPNGTPQRSR